MSFGLPKFLNFELGYGVSKIWPIWERQRLAESEFWKCNQLAIAPLEAFSEPMYKPHQEIDVIQLKFTETKKCICMLKKKYHLILNFEHF